MNPHPTPQDGGKQEQTAVPTPTPWRFFKTQRHGASGNLHADLFVIESDTRKSMATLEVWALNADPKWREEHPQAIKDHAETLAEVEANAAFIVSSVNSIAGMREENRELREALEGVRAEMAIEMDVLKLAQQKNWRHFREDMEAMGYRMLVEQKKVDAVLARSALTPPQENKA